jgi:hypothetical protein
VTSRWRWRCQLAREPCGWIDETISTERSRSPRVDERGYAAGSHPREIAEQGAMVEEVGSQSLALRARTSLPRRQLPSLRWPGSVRYRNFPIWFTRVVRDATSARASQTGALPAAIVPTPKPRAAFPPPLLRYRASPGRTQ